jgi:acetyl esterase/lipase
LQKGTLVDLSRITEELRPFAKRQVSLNFDRWIVRFLLRLVTRWRPTLGQSEARIEIPVSAPRGLRIYRPPVVRERAALLWIHGGGYIIGHPRQDDGHCAATATDLGIVVVGPRYRLAPEHPYPAALDDCHSAWNWLQEEAFRLGIDPTRIAIGGQSAGGGLAAALVQRIHDGGGVQPIAQWLFCPMLDDRTAARRDLDAGEHLLWNNRSNRFGWLSYLGREPGSADAPLHAAPGRRADLAGLPPAWIGVGDVDLFHDEDRSYAQRLQDAGVASVLVEVAGAPHAFETWAPTTNLAGKYLADARVWLAQQLTSGSSEE